MNGFCLECHFILKKCWFEVGQSMFKHPVHAELEKELFICLLRFFKFRDTSEKTGFQYSLIDTSYSKECNNCPKGQFAYDLLQLPTSIVHV